VSDCAIVNVSGVAAPAGPQATHRFWLWRVLLWPFRNFFAPGPLSGREKQGYLIWGPTAALIATIELLGALSSSLKHSIPWPTISSTVGHLETRWSWVAVIVVASIAVILFLAIRYRSSSVAAKAPDNLSASLATAVYDAIMLVIVGAGSAAVALTGASKFQLGYTIYGLLLVFGIIGPSVWALVSRTEPTFFSTVRSLRARLAWFIVVLITGLAVLVVHLAFYPWPDITHDSSAIGGLTGSQARTKAERALRTLAPASNLVYRSEARGSFRRSDAWLVSFDTPDGFGSACVVAVVDAHNVTPSPACSRPA
jgi:hypothetical protein